MIEPPPRAVAALGRDMDGIIEHDLYPCPPDLPLPIAKRTKAYLSTCSNVNIEFRRAS
jgi:inosose dehydratase